jgi:hypothetical protein
MGAPVVGGRWVTAWLAATLLLAATAFAQDDDPKKFCAELTKNPGRAWDKAIYYRDSDGNITRLAFGDTLYRHLKEQLFYFSRSSDASQGHPGVLNIKLVYLLKPRLKPTSLVGLSNDQWANLSPDQRQRIVNACSHVTVEGYERFHLQNSRDFCLRFLFHQTMPFGTLATPERQRSFAFADMVPGNAPAESLIATFESFISSARAAEQATGGASVESAPRSYAHSIIRNFVFAGTMGQCIEIKPITLPEDATRLHLRITNLGADLIDSPESSDWLLQIQQ